MRHGPESLLGGARIKHKRDLLEKHISESLLSTSFQRHPAEWMRWIKLLFPDVARGHQERHVWHRPSNEEGVSNPNKTKESLNVLSTKAVRRYTSVSGQDRIGSDSLANQLRKSLTPTAIFRACQSFSRILLSNNGASNGRYTSRLERERERERIVYSHPGLE